MYNNIAAHFYFPRCLHFSYCTTASLNATQKRKGTSSWCELSFVFLSSAGLSLRSFTCGINDDSERRTPNTLTPRSSLGVDDDDDEDVQLAAEHLRVQREEEVVGPLVGLSCK